MNPNQIIADTYKPLVLDIEKSGHSEYWLKGGRGSTKSSFISIMIVLGIVDDANANAIIFRRVGNTIKDSVFEQMVWAIDKLGLTSFFRAKLSPLEIIYKPTGQRVMFRGADDPMKSKSIKLSKGYFKFLWFEELAEFRGMEDVRTIKQSVFRGVKHAITFYSYNPPVTMQNWTNEEAIKPRPDRLVHHSTYLDVPEEWLEDAFFAEAEALKATNERAYRHEYLGEVTGTGGMVFENLVLRKITDAELASFDRCYNGLDFGFAVDPDAFVRWHFDKSKRRLYLTSEYFGAKTSTDKLADVIKLSAGRELVTCDSAEPRMIAELQIRGLQAVGAKKGPGSIEHGMRWLQELGEIVIDPNRCPNAAREFSAYEYERDKYGNFLVEYPDKNNHTIDATRYAMNSVIQNRAAKTSAVIRRYL